MIHGQNMYSKKMLYFVSISAGILSGLLGVPFFEQTGVITSEIFIKLFKCVSLPIFSLSLIASLSKEHTGIGKVWKKTFFYTLMTTLLASTTSCLLYTWIRPGNVVATKEVGEHHANDLAGLQKTSYLKYFTEIIPSNFIEPFLQHQVMGVLLISIVLGMAIRFLPEEDSRKRMSQFFQGLQGIFLVITRWIVFLLPVGLYGFMTVTVTELKKGVDMKGLGQYFFILVLSNLIQGFVILPLWLKRHQMKPFQMMRTMMPALSCAFFSKSSAGTLPVTLQTMEKNLKINPQLSRSLLPLCTSINMNGCAAFIFTTVIFLMQNHGVLITPTTLVMWIFISTLAAIGNAGVPMGCFFLSASLLSSMKIPIELMGLILPFYGILDMVETALNVWSDSCVVAVIDRGYCQ